MTETADERMQALQQLRAELERNGRTAELAALDQVIAATGGQSAPLVAAPSGGGSATATGTASAKPGARTYLKLKKKFYTPAEVARRVGVSRQTIVKWIERGELEAELTPGGHHRIPASVFHREGRGESVQLIPADED